MLEGRLFFQTWRGSDNDNQPDIVRTRLRTAQSRGKKEKRRGLLLPIFSSSRVFIAAAASFSPLLRLKALMSKEGRPGQVLAVVCSSQRNKIQCPLPPMLRKRNVLTPRFHEVFVNSCQALLRPEGSAANARQLVHLGCGARGAVAMHFFFFSFTSYTCRSVYGRNFFDVRTLTQQIFASLPRTDPCFAAKVDALLQRL